VTLHGTTSFDGTYADEESRGLEADQKVIAAHGCYAQTATTALTAQDTKGVYDVHHTPPQFLDKLIDLGFGDVGVDVVKTGMLASAETIRTVAAALERHAGPKVVVDPVMVATSGATLLPREAVRELLGGLLPRTTVLTPNIPEAKMLLAEAGKEAVEVRGVEDFETIAKQARALGPEWVLVKGGHAPLDKTYKIAATDEEKAVVVDVLCGPEDVIYRIESPFQESKHTHGTGCSLACESDRISAMQGVDVSQLRLRQTLPTGSMYPKLSRRRSVTSRRPSGRRLGSGRAMDR
jgi:hydroxymethylpyrimidine/phosphomethylpyrimidine kinase / thiaminase